MRSAFTWLYALFRRRQAAPNPLDAMPDFQNFTYAIVIEPPSSRVSAWVKLKEVERRLAMYKWVEQQNDPAKAQHRVLLNDSVSAFLLSFEATLQFVKDQFERAAVPNKFEKWLALQPQNDLHVKGLRTLRHFEAHVEAKPIPRTVHVHIQESLSGGKSATQIQGCTWELPQLTPANLSKLRSPKLSTADLTDWNTLVKHSDASTIFREGLQNLKVIFEAAEKVI